MSDTDEIFNDSYERCLMAGNFIERFYDQFIASNELVAEKFAHTDMRKQNAMLEASLHMIMALRLLESEEAVAHFKKLGVVHGCKQHNITPEYYDLWLGCLLEAVAECDEKFSPEVEAAWREIMAAGINTMKEMY